MKALKFSFVYFVLVLITFCISSCRVEDGGKIDIGDGRFIQTNLLPVPPGQGDLLNIYTFQGVPILDIQPQEGVAAIPSGPIADTCKVISVSLGNKEIYYQGIEISTSGIIRKVEIPKLHGHIKVEIRQKGNRYVSLLATGWGEISNQAIAYIWIQTISGIPFTYKYEPNWANILSDTINIWKFPVGIKTSVRTLGVSLKIRNINEIQMLWWEPGDFYPMAEPTGPDIEGNLIVQNVDFTLVNEDGTPMAPPSKQVISAILSERGYEIIGNQVLLKGQTILKFKNDVPEPLPPVYSGGKKATTWGNIRKE